MTHENYMKIKYQHPKSCSFIYALSIMEELSSNCNFRQDSLQRLKYYLSEIFTEKVH